MGELYTFILTFLPTLRASSHLLVISIPFLPQVPRCHYTPGELMGVIWLVVTSSAVAMTSMIHYNKRQLQSQNCTAQIFTRQYGIEGVNT